MSQSNPDRPQPCSQTAYCCYNKYCPNYPNADIELAVWGIPDRVYFKAMGEVTSSSELLVEMLDEKICSPWLWQLIEKDGVEV